MAGETTLTAQVVDIDGLEAVLASADADGNKFRPGDGVFLFIRNTDVADHTITLNDPRSKTPAGAAAFNPDVAVVVTAAEDRFIGPVTRERFGDPADNGLALVNWSAATGMKIAVLQL